MCPCTELFLVRIFLYSDFNTEICFLYSVRIQENKDQNYSVFGHFSSSGSLWAQRKYAVHPKWTGKKVDGSGKKN